MKSLDESDTVAVRVICLDLSKAFDGLRFHRLINYLNYNDIDHGFLCWLLSYLSSRHFCVKVNDCLGVPVSTPSGVPQGSVLGPYLFAAFMGCIRFDVEGVHAVQYADDVTLIETFCRNQHNAISFCEINTKFQEAGMKLNKAKCKDMVILRSPSYSLTSYEDISRVDCLRILGVTLTNKLSWKPHLSNLLKRASQRLYIIRCLRNILPKEDLICVYHALVTTLFLYGSPIFGNAPSSFFLKLEKFQRRAHKLICSPSCKCERFPEISRRFLDAGLKFLGTCTNEDHPLNHLVPARLQRTGHFRLPLCMSSRRLNSFFPFYCLKANAMMSK